MNRVRRRSHGTFSTDFEIFQRRFDGVVIYFFLFRLQIFSHFFICRFYVLFKVHVNFSSISFWATICKMVLAIPSDHCVPVCLSCPVCNVGVLWPNDWMDQNETWHAGRPRPWPHCVRWGLSFPNGKGHSSPAVSKFMGAGIVCVRIRCHLVGW